jgi:hypothetical protein
VAERDALLVDGDGSLVQVDVDPPQPGGFTAA